MKMKKLLILALCLVTIASISVVATLAYFTDTAAVTNTFTVGKVVITMDEADTDNSTDGKDRDQANEYHLLPGQTYDKDPIIHVEADSEDCFLYVKVENGLSAIQKGAEFVIKGEEGQDDTTVTRTVEEQIAANGWAQLTDVNNVWYRVHTKNAQQVDYTVFEKFAIADDVTNDSIKSYATGENVETGTKIKVTAYAIQKAGFADEKIAWEKGNFQ